MFPEIGIIKIITRGLIMIGLPYFRFYPSEWLTGCITDCSLAAQGLFINIVSFYWSRDCKITEAWLKNRFSQASAELEELLKLGIIKVDSEEKTVEILFLNEQYHELRSRRKKLQKAGEKGGKKKKPDLSLAYKTFEATPKHLEEKRREEKRRDLEGDVIDQAKKILLKLNKATGKNFSDASKIIDNLINGKTYDQHIHIIEVKPLDPFFIEKPSLVNPGTLFGENFDTYANQTADDFKKKTTNAQTSTQHVGDQEKGTYGYFDNLNKEKQK